MFLLAALALLAPAYACAATYSERLQAADGIKTKNTARFAQLLATLEADKAEATAVELQYLRLLQDYRKAIRGDYGAALGDSVALFDQASDPELRFRAALLVANISAITRDFSLGLRYLERALSLQGSIGTPELKYAAPVVASTVYNEFGQFELAKHYARIVTEGAAGPRERCIARQNLVEAVYRMGAAIDESADVESAITDCLRENETIPANFIRSTLAKRWAANGKRAQAVGLLEGSLAEVEATHYTRLIGEFHSLLARYKLDLGDVAGAASHAAHVARIEGQDPRWTANVTAHYVLYEVAMKRGDLRTALEEYRLFAEADKARLDDIKAREYAFQLSRHELNQKNQSIALLTSKNRLLSLQQEVDRRTKWNFSLAIALLLVLVASFGYWGWRARRMHGSLRQLAETDGLTGLANRRHFRERSEAVLAACAERRRPVSVLLLDLDHFKQINDQCGHSAGDWVLREVARVGRLHCREQDLFGRLGGEEFAMTLVDCDAEAAMRIAEVCRRSIASIDAGGAGCGLPVTASLGVVTTTAGGYDYEALIAHADVAMYRSKLAGRNRVTRYAPPPVPERRPAGSMSKQY